MEAPKIFESEYRFCLIVWEREPVNSTELVRLCRQRLGWSKATTYTVLRPVLKRSSAHLRCWLWAAVGLRLVPAH